MDHAMKFSAHDVPLPEWGPYTRRYMGISHVADAKRGLRFDLSVFPGLYRRKLDVPNVLWESGYHPWEAAPDLGYYSHRHELLWKDQLYCDIAFARWRENGRIIRCECVNATDTPHDLILHHAASIHFPPAKRDSFEALQVFSVRLPAGGLWVAALDYCTLDFAKPRHTDNLMPSGLRRGEVRGHGFVGGSGVRFGSDAGDSLRFRFDVSRPISQARLVIRYRTVEDGKPVPLRLCGVTDATIVLQGDVQFTLMELPLGDLSSGSAELTIVSEGEATLELDGFALAPQGEISFDPPHWNPVPDVAEGLQPGSLILKYADAPSFYGLAWRGEPWEVRPVLHHEMDEFLRRHIHTHSVIPGYSLVLKGDSGAHFLDLTVRPIAMQPRETRVLHAMVCNGSESEVRAAIDGWFALDDPEAICREARRGVVSFGNSPAGEKFRFSQERMAATILTNVVFPIYARGSWIRHNTPGRWWDCLYTWDSGFTGLGLAELDITRATACLEAYLTPPGDQQAFLQFGSVVPVQIYLALELWDRTQSVSWLREVYPMLRQYHEFLAGNLGSSTTRAPGLNLLKTWDYFYNSGGWDDYPPQVFVHQRKLTETTVPVINTSQAIRCAKILRMMATCLGLDEDCRQYDDEIEAFGNALLKDAWDPESGYFGYVQHDGNGRVTGLLRHGSGQNFNMGMDGAYPLVAGICSEEQEARLCEHLFSPERMWTRAGLSTVDQSAAYYSREGYWNGAVWMPHQWFFWKTMLDLGRADEAFRIALTGLEVWRREVDDSYNCFEHFLVETGRGAGWHHFGGLSAPVLSWYGAYYRPGRLTCGFDVWIQDQEFIEGNSCLRATLVCCGREGRHSVIVANMDPRHEYVVTLNNAEIPYNKRLPGVLEIPVPANRTISLGVDRRA